MKFKAGASGLLAIAIVAFCMPQTAEAQRRGGPAVGLAAGAILGVIAAGALSQRAAAQPRYYRGRASAPRVARVRASNRSVARTSGGGGSGGGGGLTAARNSDPFAGVSPSTRQVRD